FSARHSPRRLEAAIDSSAVTARVKLVPFPFVQESRVFQLMAQLELRPFQTRSRSGAANRSVREISGILKRPEQKWKPLKTQGPSTPVRSGWDDRLIYGEHRNPGGGLTGLRRAGIGFAWIAPPRSPSGSASRRSDPVLPGFLSGHWPGWSVVILSGHGERLETYRSGPESDALI